MPSLNPRDIGRVVSVCFYLTNILRSVEPLLKCHTDNYRPLRFQLVAI